MGVDYKKQYKPEQLEPFWPNEIMKMMTAVLVTLAVIMFFAILPVLLDSVGLQQLVHAEEPADPHGATPVGIKPEWYFLASYEYLRLMPTELLGVSGKTLGVMSQGVALAVLMLVPFWYRKRAGSRPRMFYRLGITAVLAIVLLLTIKGGWPAVPAKEGEVHLSLGAYLAHKPLFFIILAVGIIVFYSLVGHERRTIRAMLYEEGDDE